MSFLLVLRKFLTWALWCGNVIEDATSKVYKAGFLAIIFTTSLQLMNSRSKMVQLMSLLILLATVGVLVADPVQKACDSQAEYDLKYVRKF